MVMLSLPPRRTLAWLRGLPAPDPHGTPGRSWGLPFPTPLGQYPPAQGRPRSCASRTECRMTRGRSCIPPRVSPAISLHELPVALAVVAGAAVLAFLATLGIVGGIGVHVSGAHPVPVSAVSHGAVRAFGGGSWELGLRALPAQLQVLPGPTHGGRL